MDAVFTGTVTDVKEVRKRSAAYYEAQVSVEESWKGVTQAHVKVYSDFNSCSFDFEQGKRYLFYAYDVKQRLDVINCGRSGELAADHPRTAADVKELGAGTRFAMEHAGDGEAAAEERRTSPWAGWASGSALGILAVSFVLTWKENRRPKPGGTDR